MLERVLVVGNVVVVVIRVGEERIACCENVRRAKIRCRQLCLSWVLYGKHLFRVVTEILAQFISEIGVSVAVSDDFYGFACAYASVVGGDDYGEICLCQSL